MISKESDKEEILAYLREKSEELGRTALKSDMTDEEKRIIKNQFSSWINAVREAGLIHPNSPGQAAIRIKQKKTANPENSESIWKKFK